MSKGNACCSFCRKDFREVGPLVEGPDAVYICGECIELCQSILVQQKRRRAIRQGRAAGRPSEEEIRTRLERCIAGQPRAMKLLAAAAHTHYEGLEQGDAGLQAASAARSAILLTGAAHSVRLLAARAVAHVFAVPFADGDAHMLREAGRAPRPDQSLLFKLLTAADFDLEAAQRGVVYIEDLHQPTAQDAVLELLDGETSRSVLPGLEIDLAGILFLCGGDFPRIEDARRDPGADSGRPLTPAELTAGGLDAKFGRRIAAVIELAPLDEECLSRVVPWIDLKSLVHEADYPDNEHVKN